MNFDEAEKYLESKVKSDTLSVHIIPLFATLEKLRETHAKPIEMTEMQRDFILDHIAQGDNIEDGMHFWKTNGLFFGIVPEDMMRAWLNPSVIVVVE